MDVVSVGPLQVASLLWQPRAGVHAMTVVCKATYDLAPGAMRLSAVQDYPNEEDNHWNDDPARSLYLASDLVPYKTRGDVLLVGDAFAPPGQAVRTLTVRLTVGSVDKRIEVVADRHFSQSGELVEGERFTRMPLRWERAGGGPDSSNPVGIDPLGEPDRYGRLVVPNLQPPGTHVVRPGDVVEPICFGPIAPTWPVRRRLLGPSAAGWAAGSWHGQPLPADIDGNYFNAAPVDQRVEELRPNERLALDHLHPTEPRLVCQLPGHTPRAFIERGGAAQELVLRADTLWLDTVRAVCTVTWRGRLELDHSSEQGRVVVALEEPGQSLSWAEVREQAPSAGSAEVGAGGPAGASPGKLPAAAMALKSVSEVSDEATVIGVLPTPELTPLPFVRAAATPSQPPPAVERAAAVAGPASKTTVPVLSPEDKSPAWLTGSLPAGQGEPQEVGPSGPAAAGAANDGASHRPAPSMPAPAGGALPHGLPLTPPPAPASSSGLLERPTGEPVAAAPAASSPWASSPQGKSSVAPPPAVRALGGGPPVPAAAPPAVPLRPAVPAGGPVVSPVVPPNPAAVAAVLGTDAAAASGRDGTGKAAGAQPQRAARADEIVELLWFAPASMDKIRADEHWARIIAEVQPAAGEVDPLDFDAEPPPEEPPEVRDRRDVVAVMTRARCISSVDLPRVMLNAVDVSGNFEPPLVMLSGRLQFPFAPVERLKATVTAVTPVAAGDKALKDTIDTVNEALQTPWLQSSGEVADGMTDKVRAAFKQANRMVSADHLDDHVERILLEQRNYQMRKVFGEEWIRALITVPGSREQVPTYLPAALAQDLPMFQAFPARVIAEAHVQQDQYEGHDTALKVVALGRVITFARGPGSY